MVEDKDISLIDFCSQEPNENYDSVNHLTERFKQFLNTSDEWINSRWMGRALKRLNLIKDKKRTGRGIDIMINIPKAQEKIKMFR